MFAHRWIAASALGLSSLIACAPPEPEPDVPSLASQQTAKQPPAATTAPRNCTDKTPGAPVTMLATAPLGVSEAHLGQPLDIRFEPYAGSDGASLFPKGAVRKQGLHQMEHKIVTMDSKRAVDANVGIAAKSWGVSAAAGNASELRFASFRASQLAEVREVDDATELREPPSAAIWYLARIYYGRSYEMILHGTSRTFTASVKGNIFFAKGGVKKFAQDNGLTASVLGRGLEPKNGDAIFAEPGEDIQGAYQQSGEPVPVFVEYRTIPRTCVPDDEAIAWVEPTMARVTFDNIDIFAGNGTWDLEARCLVNDREVKLDNAVIWSRKQGLTSSCTRDVPGPRGGVDYCRYNLYWAGNVPIVDGDRLRCGVKGVVGDQQRAIPYSEMSHVIDAKTAPILGVFGDGDSAVEYRVQYTVTRAEAPAPVK